MALELEHIDIVIVNETSLNAIIKPLLGEKPGMKWSRGEFHTTTGIRVCPVCQHSPYDVGRS